MLTFAVHALTVLALTAGGGGWPLDPEPRVVERFDPPSEAWGAGHRGVDLLGTAGQPVRAARPGTIAYAGRIAGRGVVVVSHGDTRTTYEPVRASVTLGQQVSAGMTIGSLEPGGSHCLPRTCLHWGYLRGETYLDPLTLVGSGAVRLLPLFSVLPLYTAAAGPWSSLLMLAGEPAGRPAAAGPW